jgi:hypothetical protein
MDIEQVLAFDAEHGRSCECCGERFIPLRTDQRFVDNTHRQRAYRQRVTAAA